MVTSGRWKSICSSYSSEPPTYFLFYFFNFYIPLLFPHPTSTAPFDGFFGGWRFGTFSASVRVNLLYNRNKLHLAPKREPGMAFLQRLMHLRGELERKKTCSPTTWKTKRLFENCIYLFPFNLQLLQSTPATFYTLWSQDYNFRIPVHSNWSLETSIVFLSLMDLQQPSVQWSK